MNISDRDMNPGCPEYEAVTRHLFLNMVHICLSHTHEGEEKCMYDFGDKARRKETTRKT
jgi:hypothetical protein